LRSYERSSCFFWMNSYNLNSSDENFPFFDPENLLFYPSVFKRTDFIS
jgi:hypothetical protein